jgi:hypothetical protein
VRAVCHVPSFFFARAWDQSYFTEWRELELVEWKTQWMDPIGRHQRFSPAVNVQELISRSIENKILPFKGNSFVIRASEVSRVGVDRLM